MPKKKVRDDDHPQKCVKSDATSRNTYRYSDGADVQHRLQTQKHDDLMDGELFILFMEGGPANPPF